jgi:hypothetical protein
LFEPQDFLRSLCASLQAFLFFEQNMRKRKFSVSVCVDGMESVRSIITSICPEEQQEILRISEPPNLDPVFPGKEKGEIGSKKEIL